MRRKYLTIFFLIALNGLHMSCKHVPEEQSSAKNAVVIFESAGQTVRISVDVVRTELERARGLMYRKTMPAMQGMLFIFDEEVVQSFWMKNTYIPLDIIFIKSDFTIAGAVENAEPMTTESRRVDAVSLYVVEVNAGFVKQYGIKTGDKVKFEGVNLQ